MKAADVAKNRFRRTLFCSILESKFRQLHGNIFNKFWIAVSFKYALNQFFGLP